MLVQQRLIRRGGAAMIFVLAGGAALAGTGQPSPLANGIAAVGHPGDGRHHLVPQLPALSHRRVAAFVLVLLVIVIIRFNARANPTPSKTTHNTTIEVVWTVVPVLILVAIAVPSFRLLFLQQTIPPADLTVKATGRQWYWNYGYPDSKFEYDSYMLLDKERKADQPRLLAVDNDLVVPVNKVVRVLVTADPTGVIHALRGSVVRHQDRCGARTAQRDLVQGDPRGHLLRPMLGTLRQGPRLHADRGARGEREGIRGLGSSRRRRNMRAMTTTRSTTIAAAAE